MHQTLFHIPSHVGSMPLFGFGLLLAIWAVFSVGLLLWLGRRQGFTADTWSYVPLVLLVAAAIWWLLPAVSDEDLGLPIRSYGVMLLVAVTAAVGLTVWRAVRLGLDPDLVFALAFWSFIPGIIGARLFYVIEYWDKFLRPPGAPQLKATLGAMVNVAQGGLVVYGSLVGGLLGLYVFVRRNRLPLLATIDLITPAMMLGLALGRIGCLMNGCCFGGPCEVPWGVTFPPGSPPYDSQIERGQFWGFRISGKAATGPVVLQVDPQSAAARAGLKQDDRLQSINRYDIHTSEDAHDHLSEAFVHHLALTLRTADGRLLKIPAVPIAPRSLRVHPTQIYAALNAFLLCLFLLAYDPYCRRDGQLFAMLITIYPVARFLLEIIRIDESPIWITGLSISQNVSLGLLLLAAALWAYILRQPPGKAFLAGTSAE